MARRPEGWKLIRDPRTGKYLVRFTLNGRRFLRSTRERDFRRATLAAAQIYADEQRGDNEGSGSASEPAPQDDAGAALTSAAPLAWLLAQWLASAETLLDETTHQSYKLYAKTHWMPFFTSLSAITNGKVNEYVRARLRRVRRVTLLKELAALRRFLVWCEAEAHLKKAPLVTSPPRSVTGVDHDGGRRKKVRVEIDEVEAAKILAALPERTARGLPARAFFRVMWETGLRRATLFGLLAPGDYSRGRETLRIRDEIDKTRFGRELPLSRAARAALDSVCPEDGLIFGPRHYREVLTKAAETAGLSEFRARHLSYHDWRHAALSHMASKTTDLVGMAYLAGHRDVATTSRYVHANMKAAARVIAARESAT
jgi:integrase